MLKEIALRNASLDLTVQQLTDRIKLKEVHVEPYFDDYLYYWTTQRLSEYSHLQVGLTIVAPSRRLEKSPTHVLLDLLDHEKQDAYSVYHNFEDGSMGFLEGICGNPKTTIKIMNDSETGSSLADRYKVLTQCHITGRFVDVIFRNGTTLNEMERSWFKQLMEGVIPQLELDQSEKQRIFNWRLRHLERKAYNLFLQDAKEIYRLDTNLAQESGKITSQTEPD
jgi:hypothetical protein